MQEHNNPIISYVTHFLESSSADTMKQCYSSIRDESSNRCFKQQIKEVDDHEFDSLFPLVTNVILTANKIECDSLNYLASKQENNRLIKRKHSIQIFDDVYLLSPEAYIFKVGSSYILHLNACETGSNTPGGSTDLVRYITNNRYLRPSSIISFGVCYGRSVEDQHFGDVIIPKKLYPWSVGQKINDKSFVIKHDNFNLWLEDKFSKSGIYTTLNDCCNGEDGTIISESVQLGSAGTQYDFKIKLSLGNMSTGEAVISSSTAKRMVREANGNEREIGGEMEGYGLAKECVYYAHIPCFIIKGICDWGEQKNIDKALSKLDIKAPPKLKDQLQAYAAFCAGLCLFNLFHRDETVFLSSELLNWMSDKKRRNHYIDTQHYICKESILINLKRFFDTSKEQAEEIFDLLLVNQIFEINRDGDKYCLVAHNR